MAGLIVMLNVVKYLLWTAMVVGGMCLVGLLEAKTVAVKSVLKARLPRRCCDCFILVRIWQTVI